MKEIQNTPTKTDEITLALRGLCAKRASTICYMIQQAKAHGVQDGVAFAREAVTQYGADIGRELKSKLKNPDDLLEFSQYFGGGTDRDIYEMEVVEQSEDRFYLDFHYCPYVAEWQKWGARRKKWPSFAISPWRATEPSALRLTGLPLLWAKPLPRDVPPAKFALIKFKSKQKAPGNPGVFHRQI